MWLSDRIEKFSTQAAGSFTSYGPPLLLPAKGSTKSTAVMHIRRRKTDFMKRFLLRYAAIGFFN